MPESQSPIQRYFHCANCLRQGKLDEIAVGLSDEHTLTVWCDACDQHVGSFELLKRVPMPPCSVCGENHGPGKHH